MLYKFEILCCIDLSSRIICFLVKIRGGGITGFYFSEEQTMPKVELSQHCPEVNYSMIIYLYIITMGAHSVVLIEGQY